MNLEKLKETARKFEQKEEWRKAIDVYLKAVQQAEDGGETSPDLSIYNRIGDLYLKVNDIPAAVRSYERAVDLYADQGFFNNGIALCGKILRVNPARTQTYLKLAQLHARKNVVIEAKRNLLEFLERMNALGQLEQAFQSVKTFADQFSGSQEIRMMLVELLRAASREAEAREQLEKLAAELEAVGDTEGARLTRERLQAVDHGDTEPVRPVETVPRAGDLVFLDTGVTPTVIASVTPAPGLMPTSESAIDDEPPAPLAGLESMGVIDLSDADSAPPPNLEPLMIERVEPTAVDFEGGRLDGMEGTPLELPDEFDASLAGVDTALDMIDVTSEGFEASTSDVDVEPMEIELGANEPSALPAGSELTFIDTADVSSTAAVTSLEDQVLDDPENPDLHRDLADALFIADQPERAIDELGLALAGYERLELWAGATEIVDRFLAVYPDSIRYHQKQVELAYRAGEREPLIAAYLGLGDALARTGATEKAIAVFSRVQEHDPGNVRAATAIDVLTHEPRDQVLAETARPLGLPIRPAVPGATTPPRPAEGAEGGMSTRARAADAPTPLSAASAAASAAEAVPPMSSRDAADTLSAPDDDFIDFGAMVLEERRPADTRMRVDRSEPTGENEQREFQEILEQFKRGIEDNVEADDYDAHYDLGVAFKEMGLLDEAVAEFQKAVRSPVPASRLRASEALGTAFYEKAQYAVTETVLRRALDSLEGGDETKIGLIYWLGRAAEAQGKGSDAIAAYERALAVDIRFMDLNERVRRLRAERRS